MLKKLKQVWLKSDSMFLIFVLFFTLGYFQNYLHSYHIFKVPLSETLTDDKTKMEMVYQQILKTNQGSVERKKLLNELKELYPDYFKYLDAEKSKIEDITDAYGKASKAAKDRIKSTITGELYKEEEKKKIELETNISNLEKQTNAIHEYRTSKTLILKESAQGQYNAYGGSMVLTDDNSKALLDYNDKVILKFKKDLTAANNRLIVRGRQVYDESKPVTENTKSMYDDIYKKLLAKPKREFGEQAFITEYNKKGHTNETLETALKSVDKSKPEGDKEFKSAITDSTNIFQQDCFKSSIAIQYK